MIIDDSFIYQTKSDCPNSYVSLPKAMVLLVENQHFRWENSAFRAASITSRDGDDSFQLSWTTNLLWDNLELAGENAMKHMKPWKEMNSWKSRFQFFFQGNLSHDGAWWTSMYGIFTHKNGQLVKVAN